MAFPVISEAWAGPNRPSPSTQSECTVRRRREAIFSGLNRHLNSWRRK
jgi:hypothetical protein